MCFKRRKKTRLTRNKSFDLKIILLKLPLKSEEDGRIWALSHILMCISTLFICVHNIALLECIFFLLIYTNSDSGQCRPIRGGLS